MAGTNKSQSNRSSESKQKPIVENAVDIGSSDETYKPVKISAKDVDLNQYVVVRNGFQGKLIYQSSRTGELFVWDEFGSEQEIELRELVNAKNSAKKFFIDNWFMFDEEWIIDYLGMKNFYKIAVRIEDFDEIFSKSAEEIRNIISGMSEGQKRSAAYRAKTLISEGIIDSNKSITALEETLGIELIER